MTEFKQWIDDNAEEELLIKFPKQIGFKPQKSIMVLPKNEQDFTVVIRNRRFAVSQVNNRLTVSSVTEPGRNQTWLLGENWINEEVADQQPGSDPLEQSMLHKIPLGSAFKQIFHWMLTTD